MYGGIMLLDLQKGLQTFLLLLVAICIPWLLLAKPLLLRKEHLAKKTVQTPTKH